MNHLLSTFTPHQPYLEKNTVYYNYKPDLRDALHGVIWEAYQVDNYDFSKDMAFPDICADIMVFYTSTKAHCYFMSGTTSLRNMTTDLPFMRDTKSIFGVKFVSGSLGNIFSGSVCDAGDYAVDCRDVLINGNEMIERLCDSKTFTDRWATISSFLSNRVTTNYTTDPLVKYLTSRIINNNGILKIKDLESETGYSNRYLRKKFSNTLGISMKTFSQIAQLHWSYELYHRTGKKPDLSELALLSGYYDQSHMNFAYKNLTGLLPKVALNLYNTPA